MSSNNAFERPVKRLTSARGQRGIQLAPSAPDGASADPSTRTLGDSYDHR